MTVVNNKTLLTKVIVIGIINVEVFSVRKLSVNL